LTALVIGVSLHVGNCSHTLNGMPQADVRFN